jgi:hypothetical protein
MYIMNFLYFHFTFYLLEKCYLFLVIYDYLTILWPFHALFKTLTKKHRQKLEL